MQNENGENEKPHRQPHPTTAAAPPKLPWMQWNPGDRVVVRFREQDGGLRDALGILLENAPGHVVIDTKRGPVRVEAATMVVGRLVLPPKPLRRPPNQ